MPIADGTNACAVPGQRLLLACFPKSGSTFLASILAGLPGFRKVSLVPGYGRREQELSIELLFTACETPGSFVAQHHVRFSSETERLLAMFSLVPVVLVRNIFDITASIRDSLKSGTSAIAQAFVPPDAVKWNDEQLETFIADMIVPWYFNFYASWSEGGQVTWVTYEVLTAEPVATARFLCQGIGVGARDADIERAVQNAKLHPGWTRFNCGTTGRGAQLCAEAVARINHLATYYGFLDLSRMGLEALGDRRIP